jgi:hypothetical protein
MTMSTTYGVTAATTTILFFFKSTTEALSFIKQESKDTT